MGMSDRVKNSKWLGYVAHVELGPGVGVGLRRHADAQGEFDVVDIVIINDLETAHVRSASDALDEKWHRRIGMGIRAYIGACHLRDRIKDLYAVIVKGQPPIVFEEVGDSFSDIDA